jgi:hypothetical protein
MMNPRLILGGLKSYLPIPERKYKGTGGTSNAGYSYSVWFRHLYWVSHFLGKEFHPRTVVELGPGDSIGTGLSALMSVAENYVGLDVLEHASYELNMRVLDDVLDMVRRRAPLPGDEEFPKTFPRLPSYDFPVHLVRDEELDRRTSDEYVGQLRAAVRTMTKPGNPFVQYRSPWTPDAVETGSADYVFSHGALNDMDHTAARDDLSANLDYMIRWLKPGGVMSHQIELSCEGGDMWNHHWVYGPLAWRLIRGRRPYYKNRVPLSEYKRLFAARGCPVIGVVPVTKLGYPREATASQFRDLPDEDFSTAAVFLVVVKPK